MEDKVKLFLGDCLDIMRNMKDNSVTGIVTDPPYGISFMGRKWDYEIPSSEIFMEMCRVLKPGGTMLCFAGSRTQHRMACNIEDAGFEIRDTIMWVYGSGMPKSFDIGKALDKKQGNKRISTGEIKHHSQKGISAAEERSAVGAGSFGLSKDEEVTCGYSGWDGYGTCIKPAYEPIIIAMKPNYKSFAANAIRYGVSGLNIDGCRIPGKKISVRQPKQNTGEIYGFRYGTGRIDIMSDNSQGRFPANIILDKEAGELMGKASRFFYCAKASTEERNKGLEELEYQWHSDRIKHDGAGGDNPRNRSNQLKKNYHPTVKPISLMIYLTNLLKMPENTIILDPFAGSGTTLLACIKNEISCIGIERDRGYFEIMQKRVKYEKDNDHNKQLELFL